MAQPRVFQVELALDPAPRLIADLAPGTPPYSVPISYGGSW
jgi:hypothetical protein